MFFMVRLKHANDKKSTTGGRVYGNQRLFGKLHFAQIDIVPKKTRDVRNGLFLFLFGIGSICEKNLDSVCKEFASIRLKKHGSVWIL